MSFLFVNFLKLILSDTVIEDDISPPEELFQEYFGPDRSRMLPRLEIPI